MASEFNLFRIKVFRPNQQQLFCKHDTPSAILESAINEKPSTQIRKKYTWHIGNIQKVDSQGVYFAIGRTASSKFEKYDTEQGNFIEQDIDRSPYTHVVVDLNLEVCAISRKYKLANKTRSISSKLEHLLNSTKTADTCEVTFKVSEINDPSDFISLLHSAYAVKKFQMTFTLPNPFDANRDFQVPMEKMLRDAEGSAGKTQIEGESLEPSVLEELSRSATSCGNKVSAVIQAEENAKPVLKKLGGNIANFVVDAFEYNGIDVRAALYLTREIYHEIRQVKVND